MSTEAPSFEPLLQFWLGDPGGDPLANSRRWFATDPAFDAEVRERFGALLAHGERGALESWRATPRGSLAYVILHDQIPRNVFRGTRGAFKLDARALEATRVAMARGFEDALGPIERWFLYMPLMHAEDLDCQERCVEAFTRLAHETTGPVQEAVRQSLGFAEHHRAIIARFGRFPHRNTSLGRTFTAEELEFLQAEGAVP
ncbi:DUF924 family protein [Chondromyces apiculatus]|uniref:Transmembrane protein n=1 Tax=Chondromyces apiculatus DSM 436 TaxID=1192034 RepID=A0A017T0W2_9BACT|nr:DUF924 family protein [Chondromyces apiculatus]EYF02490.1 Hypothetical protein CAP_7112 [Chondromyces apiculatus DSM 436]